MSIGDKPSVGKAEGRKDTAARAVSLPLVEPKVRSVAALLKLRILLSASSFRKFAAKSPKKRTCRPRPIVHMHTGEWTWNMHWSEFDSAWRFFAVHEQQAGNRVRGCLWPAYWLCRLGIGESGPAFASNMALGVHEHVVPVSAFPSLIFMPGYGVPVYRFTNSSTGVFQTGLFFPVYSSAPD